MAEFRRAAKAVTKAGQFKGERGRHEKDDRHRIDDRSQYVLGWSNERKLDALLWQATSLADQLSAVTEEQAAYSKARDAAIERGQVLAGLEVTREFADLDWQSTVNRIEELKAERRQLQAASAELARLSRELETLREQIADAEGTHGEVQQRLGRVEAEIARAGRIQDEASATLAEPDCEPARARFQAIADLLAQSGQAPPSTPEACDRAENAAGEQISTLIDRRAARRTALGNKIVSLMGEFRSQYPVETEELDAAVEAADGYRELHQRLTDDDLPRFQQQFKTYLNQNTIRDIAGFQSQLNKQAEVIKARIATINESLVGVDYNPGRYIRLEAQPTPHTDVRDFRSDLRACTEGTVGADASDQYSEQKFLQVSRIIERLRGREGQTEADRKWTRFVTDVRNWFIFTASERYREDDSEYEHYADSAGKSGGQKEKLAYTILAASLAYQFKLEWGAVKSRTFRFAVIDEAFGRGSDESTRFALELFGRLGLQLLIVTPLQKIHVIEPYVSAVGFVDNPTSCYSRLQTLTIEEYHTRRLAHVLAASASQVALAAVAGS
ncbi:MAG TPA: SbcC/MukB-like Walker B domain-containing protein, partial [Streptosporangiaceae bacterium]|nr:SbcC/MukB-like Walker B domain-containing protein [Streptosporangiaceae bacterium]